MLLKQNSKFVELVLHINFRLHFVHVTYMVMVIPNRWNLKAVASQDKGYCTYS